MDRFFEEAHLGEKRLDSYYDRYYPVVKQDIYKGQLEFIDDLFYKNYFSPSLFQDARFYEDYLTSELVQGQLCSSELLSKHFDVMRYSYRLITLSYLLEGVWHLDLISKHFRLKNGCSFDFNNWVRECTPNSEQMKKFIYHLGDIKPKYEENYPIEYTIDDWKQEYNSKNPILYSQVRIKKDCGKNCSNQKIESSLKKACAEDIDLMKLVCSELDSLYGLSRVRAAYSLVGQSNIINTYNQESEALGCLRRFSESLAHKERHYPFLEVLFPSMEHFLWGKYHERFLQGRVYFYGSGEEFEKKGLKEVYVKAQPFAVESLKKKEEKPVQISSVKPSIQEKTKVKANVSKGSNQVKKEIVEISKPIKSAFYQSYMAVKTNKLERSEVDMMKLKYDYVFSMTQMNTLSERLKTFMQRDALMEMKAFDKLGSKEGAVPLLFLKFMIDMQEHQGLWNIVTILGDKFYVEDDIDLEDKLAPVLVELKNNSSTGNQWQMTVLK